MTQKTQEQVVELITSVCAGLIRICVVAWIWTLIRADVAAITGITSLASLGCWHAVLIGLFVKFFVGGKK